MKLYVTIFLYLLSISISLSQSNDWIVSLNEKIHTDQSNKNGQVPQIKVLSEAMYIYQFKYESKVSFENLKSDIPKTNVVRHISENTEVELRMTPNDSLYSQQYHLDLIQAQRVWAETIGNNTYGTDYVIALLDDGYEITHEDINENLWSNASETPLDLRDNDNNGFIDDHMGINVEDLSGNHAVDTHGTLVAGIIGGRGNNDIGVTGVLWDTDILLISGVSNVAEIIAGLDYAYNLKKQYIDSDGTLGANIIVSNFSGGLTSSFPEDFPDWCAMYDLLGSVGILSIGAVTNNDLDVETAGDLPTLCTSEYLIAVTNSNENDEKVLDAGYGITSVDIAAPGEDIITTANGNRYGTISGTSASCPQVAAGIALLYSIDCNVVQDMARDNPSTMALAMKSAILSGADNIVSLSETVSKGRLNLYNSLLELASLCNDVPISDLQIFDLVPNPISNADLQSNVLKYATDSFEPHTFIITDAMGKLIYDEEFSPSLFSEKSLPLSNIPYLNWGVYSFSIKNENAIASKAVMVR